MQNQAHGADMVAFPEPESFLLTPYITNESLLEAKSNFAVQVSIKKGPKKLSHRPVPLGRSFSWRPRALLKKQTNLKINDFRGSQG